MIERTGGIWNPGPLEEDIELGLRGGDLQHPKSLGPNYGATYTVANLEPDQALLGVELVEALYGVALAIADLIAVAVV